MRINTRFAQDSCISAKATVSLATQEQRSERVNGSLLRSIAAMSTTSANNRLGLTADVAVAFMLLYCGLQRRDTSPPAALTTFFFGLILFSFVEYAFHRWLFHGPVQALKKAHDRHHQNPAGYDALPFFLPPLSMLALAFLSATIVPTASALLLSGGLAAGYVFYGLSHCAIHGARFRYGPAKRWAARHHIHHHHPDKNFGVTTPLWDIVLNTRYASSSTKPASRRVRNGR
jgi:sterol desaturase/sphingolipid hydroxylase (fatty acid hydroxylase superfamily)